MAKTTTRTGMDALLDDPARLSQLGRAALVAHPASADANGCPSAARLRAALGDGLAALFSPEHGFFGLAAAGEKVDSLRHPAWNIPVHSLYGKHRRPSRAMFKGLDTVVFDLQDLSIRCYTYVSTLRYILEEAGRFGVRVVVTDRGNLLDCVVDGPLLDPAYESFVGCFPGPFVYGLTAGEAARWMKRTLKLPVKLDVVPMPGYRRGMTLPPHRWISPSPAIRSPHSALCYPVTVFFEALPAVNYGRASLMPFELIGCAVQHEAEFANKLSDLNLPGVAFHPVVYEQGGTLWCGARLTVLDARAYRPAAAAVAILSVLQDVIGRDALWKTPGSRPAFFDQLFGTDAIRRALQADTPWQKITRAWSPEKWRAKINAIQLYER